MYILSEVGKYVEKTYFFEDGKPIPVSSYGACYARKMGLNLLSIAIDGLSDGLNNRSMFVSRTSLSENVHKEIYQYLPSTVKNLIEHEKEKLIAIQNGITNKYNNYEIEVYIRKLFSCLIDDFFSKSPMNISQNFWSNMIVELDNFIRNEFNNNYLDDIKKDIREQVFSKELYHRFYSFYAPVGMGKTLTSIGFALRCANYNNASRIVFVTSRIDVIELISKTLKNAFSVGCILEHHSRNIEMNKDEILASQNWDYKVIITTQKQFFETLFSNNSKLKRLHNLENAIVILDEIQVLNSVIIEPTITMIKSISKVLNTKFIFSTATTPSYIANIENIHNLIDNRKEVFIKSQRSKYHFINNLDTLNIEELIEKSKKIKGSKLFVFTTRKDAILFFEKMKIEKKSYRNIYHISTSMCSEHRKEILINVKKHLEYSKWFQRFIKWCVKIIRKILHLSNDIIVVSTQLFETGYDIDFQCVIKHISTLDSIICSAGLSNHDGNIKYGSVYLFDLINSGTLSSEYRTLTKHTKQLILDNPGKLYEYDFYDEFHKQAMNLFIEPDKKKINNSRSLFNFKDVSNLYGVFENEPTSVFVKNYNQYSKDLYDSLKSKEYLTFNDTKDIYRFSVSIYHNYILNNSHLFSKDKFGNYILEGSYDNELGICVK